jgi:hypothetical protein
MANELFCYEQATRGADEHGAASSLWAEALADTVGEPNRRTARYKKFRGPTLGGEGSQSSKISAKPPEEQLAPDSVQDANPPPPLAMSGYDFYRAACFEAHARLLNLP